MKTNEKFVSESVITLKKNRELAFDSDEYRNCGFRVGSKVRLSDNITRHKMEWNDAPTNDDIEYEERMKKSDDAWKGAVVTVSDALILYNPFTYEPVLCIWVENDDLGKRQLVDYKADIVEVVKY